MRWSVAAVERLVAGIVPGDGREAADQRWALSWLRRTDDVFRRVKPAVPDPHLVSYVVPVDPGSTGLLLGEHRNARLWLPPGGHVEVDEDPTVTAAREAAEELGVQPGDRLSDRPVFLSVNRTVGIDAGHTDVSLWYVLSTGGDEPMHVDRGEFRSARWWSREQVLAAPSGTVDPALGRFVAKLAAGPVPARDLSGGGGWWTGARRSEPGSRGRSGRGA